MVLYNETTNDPEVNPDLDANFNAMPFYVELYRARLFESHDQIKNDKFPKTRLAFFI